jgi:hypothetical protein
VRTVLLARGDEPRAQVMPMLASEADQPAQEHDRFEHQVGEAVGMRRYMASGASPWPLPSRTRRTSNEISGNVLLVPKPHSTCPVLPVRR